MAFSKSRSTSSRRSSHFRSNALSLLPIDLMSGGSRVGYLTAIVLAASIILGGATRYGSLNDVILQLLAVILLVGALHVIGRRGVERVHVLAVGVLALIVAVPLIQLIPLPLDIWHLLPARASMAETYKLIARPQPASPITVSRHATWLGMLSLLPPIAIFLGVLTMGEKARWSLCAIVIFLAILSVFLGLLQLGQGPTSPLRFYEITNSTEAVGFFANRNHFAALLYVAMAFIVVHIFEIILSMGKTTHRRQISFRSMAPLVSWSTMLMIVIAGQMIARSRAGLLLTALAALAPFALGLVDPRLKIVTSNFGKALGGLTLATLVFLTPLGLARVADRLGSNPSDNVRIPFARNTIGAARAYMPWGSGVGTFVPVYQTAETTSDIGFAYANHAHNDLLEVWLETGVAGIFLLSIVSVWVAYRAMQLWVRPGYDSSGLDLSLQRSASLALILLLTHSLVDYPLRTSAMSAIAAMAAAFLFPPLPRLRGDPKTETSRHKRDRPTTTCRNKLARLRAN